MSRGHQAGSDKWCHETGTEPTSSPVFRVSRTSGMALFGYMTKLYTGSFHLPVSTSPINPLWGRGVQLLTETLLTYGHKYQNYQMIYKVEVIHLSDTVNFQVSLTYLNKFVYVSKYKSHKLSLGKCLQISSDFERIVNRISMTALENNLNLENVSPL